MPSGGRYRLPSCQCTRLGFWHVLCHAGCAEAKLVTATPLVAAARSVFVTRVLPMGSCAKPSCQSSERQPHSLARRWKDLANSPHIASPLLSLMQHRPNLHSLLYCATRWPYVRSPVAHCPRKTFPTVKGHPHANICSNCRRQ